tara:strand:+ start:204 stop:392 length:189 start_codon:yes stop_codon:yes gene_type:complete
MTLQEVVDALKAWVVDVQAWFADGYQHLNHVELMQLTLGQAAFTGFIIYVFVLIILDMIKTR